ncbi:MAG: hypothetical protein IKK82_13510 [Kiritimatiellae bacterium]|nr:hypothetical protein [Kiritimatiellia bacterium]
MSTAADNPVRHIIALSGGKAASCVCALDMLGPILAKHYPKPIVGGSMWHGFSLADIHAFLRLGTCPSGRRRRRPN